MSRRIILAMVAGALILLLNRSSMADPRNTPLITVHAGDEEFEDIPTFFLDSDPPAFIIGTGIDDLGWSVQTSNYALGLSGELIVDPVVTFGFTATNFLGVPVTFGTTIIVPVVLPASVLTVVDSSIGYTMTDGGSNGVLVTPSPLQGDPDGDLIVESLVADLNGTNLGVDVGGIGVGAASTTTVTSFSSGPLIGPAGAVLNVLTLKLLFVLSPGDTVGITGRVQINAIPEPSTLILSAAGLIGVMGFSVRRRKRQ